VTAAHAAAVRSLTVIIAALNGEIANMEQQVTPCFRGRPDAAIYLSQPGTGEILGAQQLGDFRDDPHRNASAKARKNYASTSTVTRQSDKKIVLARLIRNGRLASALCQQGAKRLEGLTRCPCFTMGTQSRPGPLRHAAGTVQPAGRDLARLPEDRNRLRRSHRLVTPSQDSRRRLTIRVQECRCQTG